MAALVRKANDQLIPRRFGSIAELTAEAHAGLVDRLDRTGKLLTRPFDAAACRYRLARSAAEPPPERPRPRHFALDARQGFGQR